MGMVNPCVSTLNFLVQCDKFHGYCVFVLHLGEN